MAKEKRGERGFKREIVGKFLPWDRKRGRIAEVERRRGRRKGANDEEGTGSHLPSPVLNLLSKPYLPLSL